MKPKNQIAPKTAKVRARKPAAIKVRKMWQDPVLLNFFESNIANLDVGGPTVMYDLKPVFVLPADAASVEAMVEQVARALLARERSEDWRVAATVIKDIYLADARAALTALSMKGGER